MKLYFLLFGLFLVQEPISSNTALLEAYQRHYNLWLIHILFIVATILDTIFFYYFGVLARRKFSQNKLVLYVKRKSESFLEFAGKNNKHFVLFLYGPIIFPISVFIAPWIEISFWDSAVFLFLGDLIFWYGFEWLLVLGVKSFIPDLQLALYAIFVISAIFTFSLRHFQKRHG